MGESATLSASMPHLRNARRQRMHETPLFMRVLENPVVRNNAALGGPKSIEIFGFSTVFLGFSRF